MPYQHICHPKRTDRETSRLAARVPKPRLSSFNPFNLSTFLFLALTFLTTSLRAQFPGGGGFPFGGGGGQNQTRSSTSSGQYPNNQVGDAVFAIDPDTRKLIVIADEDTSK